MNLEIPLPDSNTVDWKIIEDEILCPLCNYILRGLVEPRCPECGFRFSWPELVDPSKRIHPYLFEHHPEANIRSFVRTMIGGLRPKRFWSGIHPAQPSRLRRLVIYGLAPLLLVTIVPVATAFIRQAFDVARMNQARRAPMKAWLTTLSSAEFKQNFPQFKDAAEYFDTVHPVDPWPCIVAGLKEISRDPKPFLTFIFPLVAPAFWPILTFAAMMVFQASRKRARVRNIHVFRCVVYSSDVLILLGLLLAGLLGRFGMAPIYGGVLYFFTAVCAAAFMYRFAKALRYYMRFDRPYLTTVATQIIVGLIVLQLLILPMLLSG